MIYNEQTVPPAQPTILDIIKQHKGLFFLLFLVSLLAIILILLSLFSLVTNQKNGTSDTNTLQDLSIVSTFPPSQARDIGLFPTIQVTFSKTISQQEQDTIRLSFSPTIDGTARWSSSTLLLFTPKTPLQSDVSYSATVSYKEKTYSWSFRTVPVQNVSTEDQIKAQSQADQNFGEWQRSIDEQYPWYNNLPLHTKQYFVYFDLDSKSFSASLYPQKASSISVDTQVAQFKNEITQKLQSLGIDITQYEIIWEIIEK